jgi:tetratricopeptide (TPR) repeat protein
MLSFHWKNNYRKVIMTEDENGPEIVTIWVEAKEYVEKGNYAKAIETYKYILLRYADNPIALEYANAYLGDLHLSLDKIELATRYIQKAIKYNPQKPEYRYILGFIYSRQNQWGRAILELAAAVNAKPDNAEYIRCLGWAISNEGDKPRGIKLLKQAMKLEPSNVHILLDLANVYLLNIDFKNAKQYAEQALSVDPMDSLSRITFEKICQFQKLYEKEKQKGE